MIPTFEGGFDDLLDVLRVCNVAGYRRGAATLLPQPRGDGLLLLLPPVNTTLAPPATNRSAAAAPSPGRHG